MKQTKTKSTKAKTKTKQTTSRSKKKNHDKQEAATTGESPPAGPSKPKTTKNPPNKRKLAVYATGDLIREKSPIPQNDNLNQSFRRVTVTTTTTTTVGIIDGKRQVQCNLCKRHMPESRLANHIRLMHLEFTENVPHNNPKSTEQQQVSTDTEKDDANNPSSDKNLEINKQNDIDQNTVSRPYRCQHCGKCYAIKYTWQQHVKTHLEGRPKCPDCPCTFATTFGLFRHRVRHHNIEHNLKLFNCPQCSKDFFSSSELNLHQQRHSTTKEYVCPQCHKGFKVKGNLRTHMRTHTKEKLYRCDICSGSFSHPYSLLSHRRIHTNDLPFKCEVCDKNYRSKHQLTSHKLVHTSDRPYKCAECPKTFRSRTAFKMHQDEHKGIKRFCCKYCERLFQCQGNKLKHERRHEGIKNHKCDICSKAFIEKQELKNHLKTHDKRRESQAGSKKSQSPTKATKEKGLPNLQETSKEDHVMDNNP